MGRRTLRRMTSIVLTVAFALSAVMTGTLGWQSISQGAKNELGSSIERLVEAELLKLEKLPDGTGTENPVPGASFYLFTAKGEQIGGLYYTDENGKIPVRLPPGDYYFEEAAPAPGFDFDRDEQGQRITRYPFTITGEEIESVVVTAYNIRRQGPLMIEKTVRNADGSPLTEEQIQQEFTFVVTFSDGGTYSYRIDGGEPQQIASGGTLVLKHGQKAVFEGLPMGVTYRVTEQPVPGYAVSASGHTGTITEAGSTARFVNTYAPEIPGGLEISKEVKNADGTELTEEQKQKEFAFVVTFSDGGTYEYTIDGGEPQQIASGGTLVLKHGQTAVFQNLPEGVTYTVTEVDYSEEGYFTTVRSYTGIVIGNETVLLPFVNVYQPKDEPGSLEIEKEVIGNNPDPNKEFTFEVTFSDGGTYEYTIDGGEPQQLPSGGTLVLKHGQTAVFQNLPNGITYTVREVDTAGYLPVVEEVSGTIVGGEHALALFQNRVPEEPGKLIVTKQLAGEYPEADKEKEFHFTLIVDGVEQEFTLKPGESMEFELPPGAHYEVREDDYFPDGYIFTIENGYGTIVAGQTVTAVATNTFVGEVQTDIEGEKTWVLNGHEADLPEAITVRLKNGDRIVEEITVTPDENGEWHYTFHAPKYDADGNEIHYTVEEIPVTGFLPSYDGLDIVNTYIPPVEIDPPIIEKVVEGESAPETQFSFLLRGEDGAPMPEGSNGNTKIITLTGSGETELGKISFPGPGVYVYTISELNAGEDGWEYDDTVYTLTVTVAMEDGELHASYALTKNGEVADKVLFVNRYEPDRTENTEVSGTKTWDHGDNPNPPDSIIVYIYADGELVAQRLVTAEDDWRYSFDLPRYAEDGHEIIYTVGEAEIPGYTAEINGYDILNTYTGTTPEPEPSDPGDEDKPTSPSPNDPQTGDNTVLWPWVTAMVLSLLGILVTLTMEQRSRRRGKHLKRR